MSELSHSNLQRSEKVKNEKFHHKKSNIENAANNYLEAAKSANHILILLLIYILGIFVGIDKNDISYNFLFVVALLFSLASISLITHKMRQLYFLWNKFRAEKLSGSGKIQNEHPTLSFLFLYYWYNTFSAYAIHNFIYMNRMQKIEKDFTPDTNPVYKPEETPESK